MTINLTSIVSIASVAFISVFLATGCSSQMPDTSLPDSGELGSPRGYSIKRVITHFHSPYSYDACDKKGFSDDGQINRPCLKNLKKAVCNRIDYLFLTDHPDNMAHYEMSDLLLVDSGDQILYRGGLPYANQVGSCSNGFTPVILVGFEGAMLALGMTKHLEPSASTRLGLYQNSDSTTANRLRNETDALIVAPHTEEKTIEWIQNLQPDAIEVYNFHANVDLRIRKRLGFPPLRNMATFLSYLVDPFSQLIPDFGFMNFIEVFPEYNSKWNTLVYSGYKVAGLGGTDSHENIFPQIVADGERLDSHRRIARIMSNHLLVPQSGGITEVKSAIKDGKGWMVFEGLGSPVGMDFYANTGGNTLGVGETGTITGGVVTISVKCPRLHHKSPRGARQPIIRIKLKRVLPGGYDQTMASTVGEDLEYSTTQTGAYRAEITIVPRHLSEFLSDFAIRAEDEFLWIITNHLYLN